MTEEELFAGLLVIFIIIVLVGVLGMLSRS